LLGISISDGVEHVPKGVRRSAMRNLVNPLICPTEEIPLGRKEQSNLLLKGRCYGVEDDTKSECSVVTTEIVVIP